MTRLMRLSEVAELLNCSVRTVYRLIGEASLPGIQIRQSWRVDPSDLENFINKSKNDFAENYGYVETVM